MSTTNSMGCPGRPVASVRMDWRTGQYFPAVDGIDMPVTSFCPERALDIANQIIERGLRMPRKNYAILPHEKPEDN